MSVENILLRCRKMQIMLCSNLITINIATMIIISIFIITDDNSEDCAKIIGPVIIGESYVILRENLIRMFIFFILTVVHQILVLLKEPCKCDGSKKCAQKTGGGKCSCKEAGHKCWDQCKCDAEKCKNRVSSFFSFPLCLWQLTSLRSLFSRS